VKVDAGVDQFWNFSQKIYAAPGVQQECLDLQDNFDVDVNVLLFCAYAGAWWGVSLTDADIHDIESAVSGWRDAVVKPLRAHRQAMKSAIENLNPDVRTSGEAMRSRIKAVELEGERIEQCMLAEWLNRNLKTAATPGAGLIEGNIRSLLRSHEAKVRMRPVDYPQALAEAAQAASSEAGRVA
jgi:uncharacterized protein (TIGR02444 family)